jgi:hypothetical protein
LVLVEPVDMSYTSCQEYEVRPTDDSGNNLDHCGQSVGDFVFVDTTRNDYRLLANAAAVNAGNDEAPGVVGVTTDLVGQPRFVGRVDMGAYERPTD